jgi:hypothetical protein
MPWKTPGMKFWILQTSDTQDKIKPGYKTGFFLILHGQLQSQGYLKRVLH